MKKRLFILLALIVPMLSSCVKDFKDIKVTSFELVSLTPVGLNRLNATIELGVSNPAPEISLSRIMGTVKYDGMPCLTITTDDVTLQKKSDKIYTLVLRGAISDEFEIVKLMKILNGGGLDLLTADVFCHAALKSGLGKDIDKKDLPLKDMMDKI